MSASSHLQKCSRVICIKIVHIDQVSINSWNYTMGIHYFTFNQQLVIIPQTVSWCYNCSTDWWSDCCRNVIYWWYFSYTCLMKYTHECVSIFFYNLYFSAYDDILLQAKGFPDQQNLCNNIAKACLTCLFIISATKLVFCTFFAIQMSCWYVTWELPNTEVNWSSKLNPRHFLIEVNLFLAEGGCRTKLCFIKLYFSEFCFSTAIRSHSPAKPVLIFVSSRRQTRLTALELIAFLATEDDPKQWLNMDEREVNFVHFGFTDLHSFVIC